MENILRHRKKTINIVKDIDAFPKTHEGCLEPTTSGGTFSLLTFGALVWLIVYECIYYLFIDTNFVFKFEPDTRMDEKLMINLDLTVAMPCALVGADVLDITGQHVMSYGGLVMEETWYELDPHQLQYFQGIQKVNTYLREEFHSVHKVLWKSGYVNIFGSSPNRRKFPAYKKDACRIHGSISLNKVSGNFHITAGKSIPLPGGHAHLAVFMDNSHYNFTHRIARLSFGSPAPGVIHPLEGDEKVSDSNMMSYQYFITVVPTEVNTYQHHGSAFQYSVTELEREISHDKGSHGTPGIFVKYDVSALRVKVTEEHEPIMSFFTRIIGIVGGIFTCSDFVGG